MPKGGKCPYCKTKKHSITKCADAKQFLKACGVDFARMTAKEMAQRCASYGADVTTDFLDALFDFT